MALNNANSNQEAFINWVLKHYSKLGEIGEYQEIAFAPCKFGTSEWKVIWND